MLCIGVLLRAGCFALWAAADGFALFAAGFVLWGVGEAFGSGSAEALLYDNLKRDGIEDEFDRMYGRGSRSPPLERRYPW
jgi:MFS family permease